MEQKTIFSQSEGDAWFKRNRVAVAQRHLPDDDPVLRQLLPLLPAQGETCLLEIGCGEAHRLAWLQEQRRVRCTGVEPSPEAAAAAAQRGVRVHRGTAEALPFADSMFDVVVFGFCLYLCDDQDLFRIAAEADRVLRSPGWLLIHDFFSPVPRKRAYHHHPGVNSRKMDNRRLFDWHPDYECLAHEVRHHASGDFTDDPDEWVAVSVLRKRRREWA